MDDSRKRRKQGPSFRKLRNFYSSLKFDLFVNFIAAATGHLYKCAMEQKIRTDDRIFFKIFACYPCNLRLENLIWVRDFRGSLKWKLLLILSSGIYLQSIQQLANWSFPGINDSLLLSQALSRRSDNFIQLLVYESKTWHRAYV